MESKNLKNLNNGGQWPVIPKTDNHKVAAKLIKTVTTSFLTAMLLSCQAEAEEITDDDRDQLEQLLDEVA